MEDDELRPEIIDDTHIKMIVRSEKCAICKKHMIQDAKYGVFPHFYKASQDAQIKLNNLIVFASKAEVSEGKICVECRDSGRASFECQLCKETKPMSNIQQSFGDPADHLCKNCYATVPAKEWESKVDELEDEHQYDFQ